MLEGCLLWPRDIVLETLLSDIGAIVTPTFGLKASEDCNSSCTSVVCCGSVGVFGIALGSVDLIYNRGRDRNYYSTHKISIIAELLDILCNDVLNYLEDADRTRDGKRP